MKYTQLCLSIALTCATAPGLQAAKSTQKNNTSQQWFVVAKKFHKKWQDWCDAETPECFGKDFIKSNRIKHVTFPKKIEQLREPLKHATFHYFCSTVLSLVAVFTLYDTVLESNVHTELIELFLLIPFIVMADEVYELKKSRKKFGLAVLDKIKQSKIEKSS